MENAELTALGNRISEFAAHLHAATAELASMAAQFDSASGWCGEGMRGCSHWLSIEAGLDTWHGAELVRVGHALEELPLIRAAFAAGRLSFDKVRTITRVATAADEDVWLNMALSGSASQLARICRAYRDAMTADDPERTARQQARRRLSTWWRPEDGMLEIVALLPPEDGHLVLNAIEAAVARSVAAEARDKAEDGIPGDELGAEDTLPVASADPREVRDVEPWQPYQARRADALVSICAEALDRTAAAAPGSARPSLVVHVDLDTLSGASTDGRCHLENGPAIAVAAARRIGCNADVVAILEKDGVPLDVGRTRRTLPRRLERLVKERDTTCLYPVCPVPSIDAEVHHVEYWTEHEGPSDLVNLVSLCRFHHHRLHDDEFRIVATTSDPKAGRAAFRFQTRDGRVIGGREVVLRMPPEQWLRELSAAAGREIDATTPVAGDHGGSFDLDHAIEVIAMATIARRRDCDSSKPPRGS